MYINNVGAAGSHESDSNFIIASIMKIRKIFISHWDMFPYNKDAFLMSKQPSIIISGKPSVLIEGVPATTANDFVTENGGETNGSNTRANMDLIASGEPSVLIDGQPAATISSRITASSASSDTTADSGHQTRCVVSGKPTVLVNGQPASGLNDHLENLSSYR